MPAHRQQGKRPCAGRADLLYFLQQTDRETLAATAPLFGYHAPEEQEQKLKEQAAVRSNPVLLPPQKEQQPKAQESRNQQRFFRLKQRSQIQENKPVTHPPQRLLDTPPFTSSIAQTKEEKRDQSLYPNPYRLGGVSGLFSGLCSVPKIRAVSLIWTGLFAPWLGVRCSIVYPISPVPAGP